MLYGYSIDTTFSGGTREHPIKARGAENTIMGIIYYKFEAWQG